MKDKEMPPIIRVEGANGIAYYPKYIKNAQGEWELKDKTFQKMFEYLADAEKPAKTDKESL